MTNVGGDSSGNELAQQDYSSNDQVSSQPLSQPMQGQQQPQEDDQIHI